jgi:RecA/RadA recombinase
MVSAAGDAARVGRWVVSAGASTNDDLRELRRLIGKASEQASRSEWARAEEAVADTRKAFRRLNKERTSEVAREVRDLLRAIAEELPRGRDKAKALAAKFAADAATEAECIARNLAEDEAEKECAFDIIFADDIELDLDRVDLVEGLLGTSAMSVIYGESGSGKTFFTIDLACRVATGMMWRDAAVVQGTVIYIAAEGPKSVERRVWAWKRHHGVESLPLVVVRSQVNLCDPNGTVAALVAEVEYITSESGGVALIVVDTLSRAMAGADENSPKDMTAFVGNCDRLRDATGAHVLVVHHCGKDTAKGARGHSSLRAATDTEIEVKNNTAIVTKQRDAETGGTFGFKLAPVALGQDARGRTVSTCVLEPCAAAVGDAGKGRKLGKNEKIVFEALCKTLAEVGEPSPGPMPQAGTRVVTREQLRVAAARVLPHEELKYENRAFEGALTSLVADRRIHHLDGRIWIGLG